MISDVPEASPAIAVIVAIPSARPVTSPDASTVATERLLDDQVNSAPASAWPFSSNASATSRRVSPNATVSARGDTVTDPADCITVTAAVAETSPAVAMIVVTPPPMAVTNPAESTAATVVSALDQDTRTSSITRPIWSRTSAVSCAVCPSAVSATESGMTATAVGAGATTVSAARPVTPAAVAMTSASPAPTPVTSPAASTTATAVSPDAQSNSAPATAWPLASVAAAARRSVSPVTNVSAAGATATALTSWATVTAALPDTPPALAVIVAVPLPTAVTSPDPSTVATVASSDAHVNSAPATPWPFASVASAVRRTVSPQATSVSAAGDTATALTVWASVTAALPDAEPVVAVIVAVPLPAAITSPDPSTVATVASPLDHAIGAPAMTLPFWSRTSVLSCTVAPSAVSRAVAGLTVTVVGRGGSGGAGSVAPSPQACITTRARMVAPASRAGRNGAVRVEVMVMERLPPTVGGISNRHRRPVHRRRRCLRRGRAQDSGSIPMCPDRPHAPR